MSQELTYNESASRLPGAALSGPVALRHLDTEMLRRLSRTRGIDFATTFLYRSIRESNEHGSFVRCIERLLPEVDGSNTRFKATLVVVPGAFYREHPETGADGKQLCALAESRGCRTHVLPTKSVGTAAENGRIICEWLLNESEPNTLLCSLSKGGADVKMAMTEPEALAAFRHVRAWINVGGITSGSPMVSWLMERPWLSFLYRALFWFRGQDFDFVRELDRRSGSPLDFAIEPPSPMTIIHVLGFPLKRHLRPQTRQWHRRLAQYGPNDGATILADTCRLPGLLLPIWGSDHYLNSTHSPEQILDALLHYLGAELSLFDE